MKRQIIFGMVAAAFCAGAAMAETGPANVEYTDGAITQSLSGTPGNPEEGKVVFSTASLGNCVACHAAEITKDLPFPGDVGPALDGAADRWTEAELRGLVSNAKMTFEGTVMPAFYKSSGYIRPGNNYTGKAGTEPLAPILNAQQVEDVVAFLLTFKE
ncbi:sulfur oxidation c-type cytochrome SoxX [Pseudorhodobacter turbinis]|uniref:Sulfur oxidation c-type cytochrome SoxX n=1 Tax=Pseudorhodobacter turbinis TaxID=2500533 RepID=A0A4P8EFK0_9RHOB|nr:sulfur oxidation c-type cytochrome SoxX [Pseudorhodobacter turbinis]QCO55646.1 sulfur oxidation c-type cytochrome SoxX [Pseudorhodobacter turbinis]